ncbi:MAG: hypothetical protein PHO33_00185 [Clostridia bacterium]|nr:hypothetical protein [Clostridia bacterium]
MLNKKELLVMKYLYARLAGRQSLLISPEEIVGAMPISTPLTAEDLSDILKGLTLDGYIDVVNTDKKGAMLYCISLKFKGEAFNREIAEKRKTMCVRVCITVGLAILSFIITLILKAIF